MDINPSHMQFEFGAILTAFAAFLAGWYGVKQYTKSERWKRAEFALGQCRMLSTDQTFAFCCQAIDWGRGPLFIPDKYRPLFAKHPTATIEHDWRLMGKAMLPDIPVDWDEPETKSTFLLYRYCFDEFFSYLDIVSRYLSLGLVEANDFAAFDDYFKQLLWPRYWNPKWTELGRHELFYGFLKAYYGQQLWPFLLTHFALDSAGKPVRKSEPTGWRRRLRLVLPPGSRQSIRRVYDVRDQKRPHSRVD